MSKLYVVATPIGNLGDVTLRALDTLREVAVVYAEDTRVTKKLLDRYEIVTPLRSYREAQPRPQLERTIAEISALLSEGKSVAFCSDAGTPGVSDPGDYLVRRMREAGHEIIPIPGASALAAILSVAGAGVQHPLFEGFLPHKKGRQTRLGHLSTALAAGHTDGIIFYESPERTLRLLDELLEWKQELSVCLGRELTKQFEEVLAGSLMDIKQELSSRPSIKGEVVLLVHG
jgi:16S rRNA (cytidine1402-2'-O)-methyltransferase